MAQYPSTRAWGIRPINWHVNWNGDHDLQVARDRIVEEWSNDDKLEVLRQTGTEEGRAPSKREGMVMYDAIVIGARCAGSPTAMLLARKGYRVLLVDRASFPSDVVNGYYIQQHGAARLKRWGLLDRLRASNCPPLFTITFDVGEFSLSGSPPHADGVAEEYAPHRTVLDKMLVDAATEAGLNSVRISRCSSL
jgi:hypothetical protein